MAVAWGELPARMLEESLFPRASVIESSGQLVPRQLGAETVSSKEWADS